MLTKVWCLVWKPGSKLNQLLSPSFICVCVCLFLGIYNSRNTIVIWLGTLPLFEGVIFNEFITTLPRVVSLAFLDSGCPVVCPTTRIHAMTQGVISCMRKCDYFLKTTPMTCSSPRRPLFLHTLSFECTSKLCVTFLNQFSVFFIFKNA